MMRYFVCTVVWGLGAVACSAGGASPDPAPTVTLSTTPNANSAKKGSVPGAQISCVNADGVGRQSCTAPEQVCCYGEAPACVVAPAWSAPDVPTGTSEEAAQELLGRAAMEHRGAIASACEKSVGPYGGHAACDDSSDCAEGTRCCEQYIASGAPSYSECAASCDVGEVCRTDAQCRIAGAACLGGTCRQAPEKVKCGKGFCSRDKPMCCGSADKEPICASESQCEKEERSSFFQCNSKRDCLEGYCQRGIMGGSYCTLLLDVMNAAIACERDDDCDDAICLGNPGKGACNKEDKSCECVP